MPLLPDQFLERLTLLTDPDDLCDILGLTSEDIIERFSDVIEYNIDVLKEIYDIDINLNEAEYADD